MKVSLNFVSKFVDLSGLTPEEIAHRLTFAGVEVESIEKLGQGTKLVVGEVLDMKFYIGTEEFIPAKMKVVRVKEVIPRRLYDAGLQITEMKDDDYKMLTDYLETNS